MRKAKDLYQVSLKLLLKNKKGEILVLNHRRDSAFFGFYDLSGGRIHKDEFKTPLLKILKREIKEETGNVRFIVNPVPVAVGRTAVTWAKGKEAHFLFLFFEGTYLDGKVTISSEHTGFTWLNLSKTNLSKYFTRGILEGIKMYIKH